jgi:hypothetical protein
VAGAWVIPVGCVNSIACAKTADLQAEPTLRTPHGLAVQLDAGSDGQSFYARVASDVLSVVRARSGKSLIANSCLVLKSGSGVKCP